MDHFEVFGLPRRLAIDTAELQRRFYELSRRYHPDFHQAAPPEEQARALEASARLNAAYRALRDPIARVEYLVRLEEGRDTKEGATVKPKAPPELLEEMFEIQEALAEAKAGGLDEAGRAAPVAQRDRVATRLGRCSCRRWCRLRARACSSARRPSGCSSGGRRRRSTPSSGSWGEGTRTSRTSSATSRSRSSRATGS